MCGVCEERRLIGQMQVCTDDLEVGMHTLTLDSVTSLHASDIIIQKLESHLCTTVVLDARLRAFYARRHSLDPKLTCDLTHIYLSKLPHTSAA